tara:strand:+ start:2492 stop:3637 length:1146 start_codon:yes stop_codon:yes gene_type:complete
MAITIDFATKIISVPRNDMTLLTDEDDPIEIRRLTINDFRIELRVLEASQAGIDDPDTHIHNPSVTVGGVVLARVVEIINGYSVTFEDGQYAVNLAGANSNIADVVNVNQVSVRSANSAGLQDLSTLLTAAYQGQVVFNTSGQAGTAIPVGTRATPVDNFADAITISNTIGIRRIQMASSGTLQNSAVATGKVFSGDNSTADTLTITTSAEVTDCTFENLKVTGVLDGNNTFKNCEVQNINYVNGLLQECSIVGTIEVDGNAQCNIVNCWSGTAGIADDQLVTIDMGTSGNSLALRNFSGGIKLINYAGSGSISLDFASGRVVIDATCTGGTIGVRGICDVTDNSAAGCTVSDETVNSSLVIVNNGVKNASLLIPHTQGLN